MRAATLRRVLVLSTAMVALSACNTLQTAPTSEQTAVWDGAIRTEVEQQLAQSASRAANALETLAMIQRVRTEPVATPIDESGMPDELRRLTTVEWSGPADALVRELAANIGYAFSESGNRPAHPAMVQVDVRDVSAAKALEDIGLQVQRFATIVVDPNLRRVEYRHETAEAPLPQPARSRAPSLRGSRVSK